MADLRLRINELPEELTPAPIDNIAIDGPSTRRTSLQNAANAVRPYSTEAQAREGLNNASAMTPLSTSQAIETLGGQRFATTQQGNKADTAVQPTRAISAGDGLTGGGTLANNVTLALSSTSLASLGLANTAVQPARQIIAGTGITGGGTLAADRTLSLDAMTLASLGKADSAVQPARTVSAGTGLSGGGDLSANRSFALNAASIASLAKADSAVQPTRSVNAGTGLSGGGDLSANRTVSLSTATQASLSKADTAIQAPGGSSGQVLTKNSATDGDVAWQTVAGATAVSYGPQSLTGPQQAQARSNISAFGMDGGTLNGDVIIRKDLPGIQLSSPSYANVYRLFANVSDTVDGGVLLRRVAGNAPIVDLGLGGFALDGYGHIRARAGSVVYSGAAFLSNDGNINGSVWSPWGSSTAFQAISLRIESRAQAWAIQEGIAQTQTYLMGTTYPIGTYLFGIKSTAGTVSTYGTVAGTDVDFSNAASAKAGGIGVGTWMVVGAAMSGTVASLLKRVG